MGEQFVLLTNEDVVHEYFKRISDKDVRGLVDLFDNDCTIYEPFSKEHGLHGKEAVKHFFQVAVMANAGLNRTVRFVDNKPDSITALVKFERGDSITGKFHFNFVRSKTTKKVKILRIQFLE